MTDRIPDPTCDNFYEADPAFQALLSRILDSTSMDWARPRLERMGRLAPGEIDALAFEADANPPVLAPYDRRGDRTERIALHPSYARLKQIAYGEGIVADYYDAEVRRLLGRHTHQVKFALGYLFAQAEQGLYCPVCMTDGAARLLEHYGSTELKTTFLARLTSRPPDFWQGAMFLTEKQCGSDVGATETVARPGKSGEWLLTGDKWFCSNADTDVAMVLARPEGAVEGTRGLGLFAMPRRLADGRLNGYQVMRLKNKLGTRSMPTGEARLDGAQAWLVGGIDYGFACMTDMLNLSRLYNAVASVAIIRRVLREAALYCRSRSAFGKPVASYPMVQETLVGLELELQGALALVFETVASLDRLDSGETAARPLLRLLTPLGKLTTAKLAVRAASESLELLGGNGYVEDRVTARMYRDAQVLPVWEGTTNILVLDCFRAMKKEKSLAPFSEALQRRQGSVASQLPELGKLLEQPVRKLLAEAAELMDAKGDEWTVAARAWCFEAAQVYEAAALAEAAVTGGERAQLTASAFIARFLCPGARRLKAGELQHQFKTLVG